VAEAHVVPPSAGLGDIDPELAVSHLHRGLGGVVVPEDPTGGAGGKIAVFK